MRPGLALLGSLFGMMLVGAPVAAQLRFDVAFGPAWRFLNSSANTSFPLLDNGIAYGFGIAVSSPVGEVAWMAKVTATVGMPVRPRFTTNCSDGCGPSPRTIVAPARLLAAHTLFVYRPGGGPLEFGAGPSIIVRSAVEVPANAWGAGVTGRVSADPVGGVGKGLALGVDVTRLFRLTGDVEWLVSPTLQYRF